MKNIAFPILVSALMLTACAPTMTATPTVLVTSTSSPTPTKTHPPTETPTATATATKAPVVQQWHEFPEVVLEDGSTLKLLDFALQPGQEGPEFAAQPGQDAIDYISEHTLWRSGDRHNTMNTWLTRTGSRSFFATLRKIPGYTPKSNIDLPGSGENFFLIHVDQVGNGTIVIFQDNEGKFVAVYVEMDTADFISFARGGKYPVSTPGATPTP